MQLQSVVPPLTRSGWRAKSGWIVLPAILVLALLVRLAGLRFGLPALNDPDELMFEMGSVRMLRSASLNPGWFGHPATTTMYLLSAINAGVYLFGHALGWFADPQAFLGAIYADPSWFIAPGRFAMALFGVWCVALTYRLGKALFDPASGLAAAALLALDPVHVGYSQVIRSDIMASAFMLLALLAAVRIRNDGRWRDVVLAGIWVAAAAATKWPFAAVGLGVVGACLLRMANPRRAEALRAARKIAVFSAVTLAALVIISPYLVLDYATALKDVQGESQTNHVGANGGAPLWNALWYVRVPLASAFGYVGLALAAGGIGLAARRRPVAAILFPVMLALFTITIFQHLIWVRWILPLVPLLSVLAGFAAVRLVRALSTRFTAPVPALGAALAAIVLVPLAMGVRANATERNHDTRQIATRWAERHIPPGSTIIIEHFGFDLMSRPWNYLFPLVDAGCVDARALLGGKVEYGKIQALRGGHHNVDYGTLYPARRGTCRADYAILSQYDRYAAEASLFPAEMASYKELLSRSTLITTIRPQRGISGGPQIRIVRIERLIPEGTGPLRSLPVVPAASAAM